MNQGAAATHDRVRDLDLNLIAVFDCLLRFNSVGETADRLGITQSAASRSLARLRKFFNDPLFVKTNNRMLPTARAERLAPVVGEIMGLVRDSFLPEISFDPALSRRVATISTVDLGEMTWMPRLFQHMRKESPGSGIVTVPLSVAGRDAIEGGAVNLVIAGQIAPIADMLQQKLFDLAFAVICHPDFPCHGPIDPAQYAAAEHVIYFPTDRTQVLQAHLAAQGIERQVRVRTPHMLIVPEMVTTNPDLLATVPVNIAQTYEQRGLVRILEPMFDLPTMPVYQFWHRRFDREPFNIWLRTLVYRVTRMMD